MKPAQLNVFARYILIFISGLAYSNNWLPPNVADMIATDPQLVELVVEGLLIVSTLLWYGRSASRQALSEKVSGDA